MSEILGLEEKQPVSQSSQYDSTPPQPDPELPDRIKRGANWFYWVAALSVVNSAFFIAGANLHFLAGLGVTEIADAIIDAAIQQGAPTATKGFSIVFDLVVIAGFAFAGYFANKFSRTAFLVGLVFYLLDGIIVLVLGDFFMAAFHAFATYSIVRGFLACRELKAFERNTAISSGPPPPPPSENLA